jgi:hypothetical protein
LRRTLTALLGGPPTENDIAAILAAAIIPDSPKRNLIPNALALAIGPNSGTEPLEPQFIIAGDLGRWGSGLAVAPPAQLIVDPTRGRLRPSPPVNRGDAVFVEAIHIGATGEVGAGSYDRRAGLATEIVERFNPGPQDGNGNDLSPGPVTGFVLPLDGIHEFADSKTYIPDPPQANLLGPIGQLTLQAADRTRPYIRLVPGAGGSVITLAGPAPAAPPRSLTIDGLWIGIVPEGLADQNLPRENIDCVPVETRIVIEGTLDRVVIRRATLDPGGERARIDPLIGAPIPYVALEVRGQVEELIVEGAILGPIREATNAGDPCSIERLTIRDSIVQSLIDQPAVSTRVAAVTLVRSTVFGDVEVDRLDATDSLVCFRFSAAADGARARLPRQYRSQVLVGGVPNHWFVACRFGQAGYGQLSETCPDTIRRGGKNGAEMGVFNRMIDAIRRDDVRIKLDEYAPISVITNLVVET